MEKKIIMEEKILLEFNEELQDFHYNKITNGIPETKINTNGYKELFVCKDIDEANLFCEFLFEQFRLDEEKKPKLKIKVALHTLNNLTRFIDAYKFEEKNRKILNSNK